jgi:aspartyl-tRNA(Asn)/glutamyl-tRNA(Gln) amidotransferase subunit A
VAEYQGEPHQRSARAIADEVRGGGLRARDVLEASLDRIERLNPLVNAFVFLDPDRARAAADAVDARVAAGEDPGPLAGVPLGIKELESVEGWPDTRASTARRDRIGSTTSTMTSRLLAAGAVPVGLTASPEIGHLPYTASVLHGPTRNPWNLERTPGGSSGGAGAALAAGLVPLATGSDMGGSIRLPAGWSGVVGVKGTLGRIPRGPGWVGHANMIHYGPLARTVGDAARFLDVAAGTDERDPTSLPAPSVPFEQAMESIDLGGLRVAVVDDNGLSPSHPEVRAVLRQAADALIAAAGLREVPLTLVLPDILPGAAAMLFADGEPEMAELMPEVMGNLFATEGAAALMEAAFATADLSLEAVALSTQVRHALTLELARAFGEADLLLLPTSPVPAFGCSGPLPTVVDGREVGPQACALFTGPFNMSGHPVVSVPMGMVDGAPVGMQIVARRHQDALALAAALAVERARPWPLQAPDLAPASRTG